MIKTFKDFMKSADLEKVTDRQLQKKKMKTRKTIFSLVIDFSIIPQVVLALWLYRNLTVDSVVLKVEGLQPAFFAAFAEIIIFALLCIIRRFYPFRFLLIAAYLQLIITIVVNGFFREIPIYGRDLLYSSPSMHSNWIIVFAACGIILALINMAALYGYRKIKERENKT